MLIFHYTCSTNYLQRVKMLIFHYTQSKKTFREGKCLYFIIRVVKVTSGKPAGASLQEELQKSETNLNFFYLFYFVFLFQKLDFQDRELREYFQGVPGWDHNHLWRLKMLIFHYTQSKKTFREGENVDISIYVQ